MTPVGTFRPNRAFGPPLDLTKAGLSLEEGQLATQIDGRTTVKDLSHVLTWKVDRTVKVLDRLARAGVITWADPAYDYGPRPEVLEDAAPDYGAFIFPPGLMGEPVKLEPNDRKRIIWFHTHLDSWTHYELLQVPPRADEKVIKRAYRERSKQWHPDSWRFAGDLGSFETMLTQIFERVRTANEVLSDPKQRKAYDQTTILMVADEDIAEMLNEQRREEREKRRQEEAVERRKKRNPMRAMIQRAKVLAEEANQAEADGDVLKALRLAQLAEAYEKRPAYEELVTRLKKEASEQRIAPILRRAAHFESLTHWGDALDLLQEAVRIAPDFGAARVRLAFNLVMARRDPGTAMPHAQKGVHLLPNDPEAHFVLGLCYDSAGKVRAAVSRFAKGRRPEAELQGSEEEIARVAVGLLTRRQRGVEGPNYWYRLRHDQLVRCNRRGRRTQGHS